MSHQEFIRKLSNKDLATALDYIASTMPGGISDTILTEAAKRIRNQSDPFFVTPPLPDLPPLEAEAVPAPVATPTRLRVDLIARQAIEKLYQL